MKHSALPLSTTDPLAAYRDLLSPDQVNLLENQLSHPLPSAIRINSLKTDPAKAITDLANRYSWKVTPIPFCPAGWQIGDVHPSQTIEYKLGFYYIQEAASMLPVELFDFDESSPLILDLAAAPGGKTTHLVSRTKDQGLVLANDSSSSRLTGLRSVLQTWGAVHTAITHFPGELFGFWYPNSFDKVLLDAPCSMENLNPEDGHPHRAISPRERASLSRRQLNLLASAFRAVRPGGQVVYATCTLAPEEDEAVLDGLIKLFPNSVDIQEVPSRLGINAPALTSFGMNKFDSQVVRAIRLWPHIFGTSGFFTALLFKKEETELDPQRAPQHPMIKTGLTRLRRAEQNTLIDYFQDGYGFDFLALLEKQNLSLWKRGELIFLIPGTFLDTFEGLPFFSLGLLAAETTPKGYSPSAEFAARYGSSFTHGRFILPEEMLSAWLTGEDVPVSAQSGEISSGSTVIVFDSSGRNLGRGRLLTDQLKNLRKKS